MSYQFRIVIKGLCAVVPNASASARRVLLVNAIEKRGIAPGVAVASHLPCLLFRTDQLDKKDSTISPIEDNLPLGGHGDKPRPYSLFRLGRVDLRLQRDFAPGAAPQHPAEPLRMDAICRRYWGTGDVSSSFLRNNPDKRVVAARARFENGTFSGQWPSSSKWECMPFDANAASPPSFSAPARQSVLSYEVEDNTNPVIIADEIQGQGTWKLSLKPTKSNPDINLWLCNSEFADVYCEDPLDCSDAEVGLESGEFQEIDVDFYALHDLSAVPLTKALRAVPHTRDVKVRGTRRMCMHPVFKADPIA